MSEPTLSACAALVRRDDLVLFRSALFATEPARERLMTLYAFDIELSRATRRASEALIAAMRLRFWRDTVAEAVAGGPARSHEVATPLTELIRTGKIAAPALLSLIDAREMELDAPLDADRFAAWADARFGQLVTAALSVFGPYDDANTVARAAGQALARAFALRTAAVMAARGEVPLLPELELPDRTELAAGRMSVRLARQARQLAAEGLRAVEDVRGRRNSVPRAALPALLPLADAAKVLRLAGKGADLPTLAQASRIRTPEMLLRALAGRW